jgi:hypothetical protein
MGAAFLYSKGQKRAKPLTCFASPDLTGPNIILAGNCHGRRFSCRLLFGHAAFCAKHSGKLPGWPRGAMFTESR